MLEQAKRDGHSTSSAIESPQSQQLPRAVTTPPRVSLLEKSYQKKVNFNFKSLQL